jgi:hypothetical protein
VNSPKRPAARIANCCFGLGYSFPLNDIRTTRLRHLGVKPEVSPNSKTSTSSHTWRRSILWFFGGAFSTILLLVIAYFGIRMGNTSGQLPERQAKTEAELAARFAMRILRT